MNRTTRQTTLVAELRAAAPESRTARWLADHLDVSVRTIERDLAELQQSDVPVYGDRGRRGGYVLDEDRLLPMLHLTPQEATVMTVALRELRGVPLEGAARTALAKLAAVLPERSRDEVDKLVDRVRPVSPAGNHSAVPRKVERALKTGRTLLIRYRDRNEHTTHRTVEPMALLHGPRGWYLLAWCRLRNAPRGFLLDRVSYLAVGEEITVDRRIHLDTLSPTG
ncbi:helix-turn-helix transcriptional regulator [Actinocrispum wychmicini]|uniref:HTH domain-containing protein n=1 Tax=Actinocrispum wychmicini TaxID=1213861 RepID=A0A4R2J925_9PSEU|nr:WYL domain-containing protein [Actinocrispum wychmicini]TCO55194.1 HTH domain-containing protein [Actinocrispum wychmicini]